MNSEILYQLSNLSIDLNYSHFEMNNINVDKYINNYCLSNNIIDDKYKKILKEFCNYQLYNKEFWNHDREEIEDWFFSHIKE